MMAHTSTVVVANDSANADLPLPTTTNNHLLILQGKDHPIDFCSTVSRKTFSVEEYQIICLNELVYVADRP
jgi:hypothetical protein